jgi:hypothetical protein
VWLHAILASALNASLSDRLSPGYRARGIRLIGGWEGPRTVMDARNIKISCPSRELITCFPVSSPAIPIVLEYSTILDIDLPQ